MVFQPLGMLAGHHRTVLRKNDRIPGSRWRDCAAGCCCPCCALHQMKYHVQVQTKINFNYRSVIANHR